MNELTRLNTITQAIAQVEDIGDARRLLDIAHGITLSANRLYRATGKMGEVKEDRDKAFTTAVKAGEIRLLCEVKLGELLKLEVKHQGGRPEKNGTTSGTVLKHIGLTRNDSSRAQRMADHKGLIPAVVAKAQERGEIPNRRDMEREINLQEINKQKHERQTNKVLKLPENKYKTIVIDPPWPIEKIVRAERPNQGQFDYPTMTLDEIKILPINNLAAESGAHLFMWTTQKYLPESFQILSDWGFKYVFTMVWHKNGGFQPFGLPQYNCEFVVYGRKGKAEFETTKSFSTCFSAPRGRHSEKPGEFYDLLKGICPGPYIDIFARKQYSGWSSWGNELPSYTEKKEETSNAA